MTSSSDYLLDRRRMRRKLGYWRIAAIGAGLLAALIAFSKVPGVESFDKATPHLARFIVEGMITGDRDTLDLIKELENSKAAGVLLSIDSPGGTTMSRVTCSQATGSPSARRATHATAFVVAGTGVDPATRLIGVTRRHLDKTWTPPVPCPVD